jgi:hypothetical protein
MKILNIIWSKDALFVNGNLWMVSKIRQIFRVGIWASVLLIPLAVILLVWWVIFWHQNIWKKLGDTKWQKTYKTY